VVFLMIVPAVTFALPRWGEPAPVWKPIVNHLAQSGLKVYLPAKLPVFSRTVYPIATAYTVQSSGGMGASWEAEISIDPHNGCNACDYVQITASRAPLLVSPQAQRLPIYRGHIGYLSHDREGRRHFDWSIGDLSVDLMLQTLSGKAWSPASSSLFPQIAHSFVRVH
jgi:hypothetical protein